MSRRRVAIHWRRDVVNRKYKMIFRRDMCRSLDPVDQSQQGNNVARSGLIDRGIQA
jgi:hypothetical protein